MYPILPETCNAVQSEYYNMGSLRLRRVLLQLVLVFMCVLIRPTLQTFIDYGESSCLNLQCFKYYRAAVAQCVFADVQRP